MFKMPRHSLTLALSLVAFSAAVAVADHDWAYRGTLEGDLDEGYYRTHTLTLYGGYTYNFSGSCDGDCDDLDLVIKHSSATMGRDLADDDEPVVEIYVPSTRTYYVEVHMAGCSFEPCGYEVEYYRRGGQ